ncbi:MAG: SO_0444 family Cu/Zn efflux transporter [Desulfobacterales bacterium]
MPAAVSLRKQGATNGATTAFLISTPESGVDSISITYALLDPVMTVARPFVAFVTAAVAGISENFLGPKGGGHRITPDLSCPVDGCCSGADCDPQTHSRHHTVLEKIKAGIGYAFGELWEDIAKWFLFGLLLAGLITVLIPDDIFSQYLGPGLPAMLLMLIVGIPLYICATASTPIAAALILKGVSPGAALVFLLVGPATNMASLTVLVGTLGKRATAIYLTSIAVCSVIFGMIVDQIYSHWGISAKAMVGQASEMIPTWAQWSGAILVLLLSIKPLYVKFAPRIKLRRRLSSKSKSEAFPMASDCGPT